MTHLRRAVLTVIFVMSLVAVVPRPYSAHARPADVAAKKKQTRSAFELPALDEIDPVRYSYKDAIVGHTFVTARDGVTQLAVDFIRPNTDEPVPTIFLQSPYYNTVGRGYKHETKEPWGTGFAGTPAEPRVPFPEWYDEYFVPRGYAVVMQDMRGTRNSSGCQVYGGREEATDAVDMIEWIASRKWSNGSVGMTGGSYDGTVAIAAASEAPKALKAIIPIRAIDRWYDYHFFNGLQSSQHLFTPWSFTSITPLQDNQNSLEDDTLYPLHVVERKACTASIGATVAAQYSTPYQDSKADFWKSRDWVRNAKDFRAATFIIHGLNDTNVKTTNASNLWSELPKDLPKMLWWARMGHADPKQPEPGGELNLPFNDRFVEGTHRWFAQFLKGLDTGILDVPPVWVQDAHGGWSPADRWPVATEDIVFRLTGEKLVRGGTGSRPEPVTYSDVGSSRLTFTSARLDDALRISGEASIDLTYSLSNGGDTTFAFRLEDVAQDGTAIEIASAYARGAYRDDIKPRGPSYPRSPVPHQPGAIYRIRFPFVPQDYIVPAGHSLRLTLRADDERVQGGISGGATGGTVTVYLDTTRLLLPAF